MKTKFIFLSCTLAFIATGAPAAETVPKENVFATRPLGIQFSIKMVGPYSQAADLQIICLFKHKDSGDTYQGAAKDTDAHLDGLLSALRQLITAVFDFLLNALVELVTRTGINFG